MQPEELEALLTSGLPGCEITVKSEGGHYDILVVGAVFEGLRPVKKQQLVYAVLNEQIASGAIHAVNIRTYTPAQWLALSD